MTPLAGCPNPPLPGGADRAPHLIASVATVGEASIKPLDQADSGVVTAINRHNRGS